MKLTQYLNSKQADPLTVTVGGQELEGVYFRRLSAGEGLQLKDAFAGMMEQVGDALGDLAEGDVATVEEKAKSNLSPAQLRALFRFQALFTFLHMANKDGSRYYVKRDEFDAEVPDEFVQAFYQAGSEHKRETEPEQGEAEKN